MVRSNGGPDIQGVGVVVHGGQPECSPAKVIGREPKAPPLFGSIDCSQEGSLRRVFHQFARLIGIRLDPSLLATRRLPSGKMEMSSGPCRWWNLKSEGGGDGEVAVVAWGFHRSRCHWMRLHRACRSRRYKPSQRGLIRALRIGAMVEPSARTMSLALILMALYVMSMRETTPLRTLEMKTWAVPETPLPVSWIAIPTGR